MIPVIVIRPEPGCAATLEEAQRAGLAAHGFPMQQVVPVAWSAPDAAEFDAILAGSANAFRHGGACLARLRDLPVLAVGKATAEAARDAGFDVAQVGEGGLQKLLDGLGDEPRRLLRLAGRDHIALEVPQDCAVTTSIVYQTAALPMPDELHALLQAPAIVMLHSAKAAEHFAAECDRRKVHRGAITLAALGPRIAAAAGEGWRAVHSAGQPADAALLAMIGDLCH